MNLIYILLPFNSFPKPRSRGDEPVGLYVLATIERKTPLTRG